MVSLRGTSNELYNVLYVWCDLKAQILIINIDPFSSFFERGQIDRL